MCDVIECSCNAVFPVYGDKGTKIRCPRCGAPHIIGESDEEAEVEE